ncbi:MAG: 4-alpha-glucanotransferase [Verrucomicrobiota bacterium]
MELRPDLKLSGILAPLFAIRGKADLGVGDVAALRELVDWASAHSIGVVQVLPVNETGHDNSPYNAISSVALDPLTLEITSKTFPELKDAEIALETEKAFEGKDRTGPVLYSVVKGLKARLLEMAYERFAAQSLKKNDKRARGFRKWMNEEETWLSGFCLFRVLMNRNEGGERWDMWPKALQTLSSARAWLEKQTAAVRKEWDREMKQVAYIQWNAWMQWKEAKAYAESRNVALMGDVPYGVSYYSADVFSFSEFFDARWSCGAPPEPAFQQDIFTARWGQNWGVPLYRWDVMASRNYDWWRQRVRKVREVFHLFRIDHALGFFRVFAFPWRPERNPEFAELSEDQARERTGGELPHFIVNSDDTDEHRWANRVHGETILRVLLEETGPYRLIAEDLGTVPDYVRPSLQSMEIAGFKVPMWEKDWDTSLVASQNYEPLSVSTYATHDHEPLRSMWEHWMAVIAAGESGCSEDASARDWVWWEVRRLGRWAGFEVPCILPFEQVHESLIKGLLASNSWLAISMVTDLFGTSQRFNVPGAVADSNWSERVALPVHLWSSDPELAARMERLRPALERKGS